MRQTPIATIRKSGYDKYQQHLLRNHNWFLAESLGTMMFKPDAYMPERETKKVLNGYLEGKGSKLIALGGA